MNPDTPRTPREELEIKITALLMGQLSPEEAAEMEALIAADPELAALHARLRHAAHLLRESRTLPEPSAQAEPLQLSKERREKLLATFRGIKPLPSPAPLPSAKPVQKQRRDQNWRAPVALAASIAVLVGASVIYLGSGQREAARRMAPSSPVSLSAAHDERDGFADLNHPAPGNRPEDYSGAKPLSLAPPPAATPSDGRDSLASNSRNRWVEQPGAIRGFVEEKPASGPSLYSVEPTEEAAALRPGKPVESGQEVRTIIARRSARATAATGGVYLPPTVANEASESQLPALDLAEGRPSPQQPNLPKLGDIEIAGRLIASGPAGPKTEAEAEKTVRAGDAVTLNESAFITKQMEDRAPLADTLTVTDGAVDQLAVEAKSKADKSSPLQAGNRPLGETVVTAGNRSGNLAISENAIDALLFGSGSFTLEKKAQGEAMKDSPSDGAAFDAIKQRSDDAKNDARGAITASGADRERVISEATSDLARSYRRFDREATELSDESKLADTREGSKSAPTQNDYQRFPKDFVQEKDVAQIPLEQANINTQGEGTYWDFQGGAQNVRSKSGQKSAVRGEEVTELAKGKAPNAPEPAVVEFEAFANYDANLWAGGAAGARGTNQLGDFDRDLSRHTDDRFKLKESPDTKDVKLAVSPLVVTGGTILSDGNALAFQPPQIPQTFGNAVNLGGTGTTATPTTPEKPKAEFDLETTPVVEPHALSAALATAGKVQLDGSTVAAFTAPAEPALSSLSAKAPAAPAAVAKPASTSPPPQGGEPAQQEFVNAYLSVRKAEEKAAAGDAQNAQKLYRDATEKLTKIKEQWPKWQPELVEFRLKRTQEALGQAESKIALSKKEAAPASTPAPAEEPPTPQKPPEPAPVPQPEVSTKENAFSTFSLNVTDVSFQLASASLEKGVMPEPATVRSEEFINALNYRDPEPAAGAPFAFASERARYPFAHNRDLLRLSVKTASAGREPGRPLNLVLLLDNSGSMERADRVRILKESLRVLTQQLQPQDKLSLITFSRTPRLWADGVSGEKAAEFTQRAGEITPQGGTDLSAAMDLGYQTALKHYQAGSVNRLVLLTDGAANLGDVKAEALKSKVEAHRKQGVAFDCFGVGWEGYNDDLLEQLSRNGDGRYGFINTPEAAATEFAGQLAGALRVAASDVKVQVEFNPRRVLAYRQVGYAKHQLKKEQFRDNTVDAAEIGAAESGNALYVIDVNPRGEGDVATVRVRFKVPGTTDYREHEWTVPFQAPAPAMEQASSSLRLAATASAFSEWLAQSPYAAEVTTDRLLGMINGIPAIYGADRRPAKLEGMIRQAKSISGR